MTTRRLVIDGGPNPHIPERKTQDEKRRRDRRVERHRLRNSSHFSQGRLALFRRVRRAVDGEWLQSELGPNFVPLNFDVAKEDDITAAAATTREMLQGRTLDGLVNNAGGAMSEPLLLQTVDNFRAQIEIDLVGVFAVTRAFAPLFGADASLSGKKAALTT
jgi:NAD(P)-dependent dehydrogenase (short-subunit alcohol dehydrogenase family)